MKHLEFEFCMSQFKIAVIVITALVLVVLYWSITRYRLERFNPHQAFTLAAANTNTKAPPAGSIAINAKITHKYWGNCNSCHITTNTPRKPVSQVFEGPPIPVKAPMTHKYWGNCNMCHIVSGGFRPKYATKNKQLAAATGAPNITANAKPVHSNWGTCTNCHKIVTQSKLPNAKKATPAAFSKFSVSTLGLDLQNVNSALMGKWGLADEEGVLILTVKPGSYGERAGLKKGDEVIRLNDRRVDTLNDLNAIINIAKPKDILKMTIFRGRRRRNIYIKPSSLLRPVAAIMGNTGQRNLSQNRNLGQNRMETLAEQFNVPKTQSAVQNALQKQHHQLASISNNRKVVIAATGPSLNSQVATNFEKSPYFIIYDPQTSRYKSMVNPNYNDTIGNALQSSHLMVDLGVLNVIAGNFSIDSYHTMKVLHLNLYSGVTGSVDDVLNLYQRGQIRPSNVNLRLHQNSVLPKSRPVQGAGSYVF